MIYIFEDRLERRKINQGIIDSYGDLVCYGKFGIDQGQNPESFILDKFADAQCVMLHKSYAFKTNDVTVETVDKIFREYLEIPFVLYSGGLEKGNKDSAGRISLNADIMYSNLPLFLEHCRQLSDLGGDHIREILDILLWGPDYVLNSILNFQNEFSKKFFMLKDPEEGISDIDLKVVNRHLTQNSRSKNLQLSILAKEISSEMSEIQSLTWDRLRIIIQDKIDQLSKTL